MATNEGQTNAYMLHDFLTFYVPSLSNQAAVGLPFVKICNRDNHEKSNKYINNTIIIITEILLTIHGSRSIIVI